MLHDLVFATSPRTMVATDDSTAAADAVAHAPSDNGLNQLLQQLLVASDTPVPSQRPVLEAASTPGKRLARFPSPLHGTGVPSAPSKEKQHTYPETASLATTPSTNDPQPPNPLPDPLTTEAALELLQLLVANTSQPQHHATPRTNNTLSSGAVADTDQDPATPPIALSQAYTPVSVDEQNTLAMDGKDDSLRNNCNGAEASSSLDENLTLLGDLLHSLQLLFPSTLLGNHGIQTYDHERQSDTSDDGVTLRSRQSGPCEGGLLPEDLRSEAVETSAEIALAAALHPSSVASTPPATLLRERSESPTSVIATPKTLSPGPMTPKSCTSYGHHPEFSTNLTTRAHQGVAHDTLTINSLEPPYSADRHISPFPQTLLQLTLPSPSHHQGDRNAGTLPVASWSTSSSSPIQQEYSAGTQEQHHHDVGSSSSSSMDMPLFFPDGSLNLELFKVFPCRNESHVHDRKNCPFYHSQRDRRRHPSLYRAEQCDDHFDLDDDYACACPRGDTCDKCHNRHELLYHPAIYKQRFCSSYSHVLARPVQCHRGQFCAFAHTRAEISDLSFAQPLFFMMEFKTYWCPYGTQHDWHGCLYAHTYQDCRRSPRIGYGSEPCPYWQKDLHSVDYRKRCPYGTRCPYSHGSKEQLYHPAYYKTMPCADYKAKRACPRGQLCAFYHELSEKRNATTALSPQQSGSPGHTQYHPLDESQSLSQYDYTRPLPTSSMVYLQKNFMCPPLFNLDDFEAFGHASRADYGRHGSLSSSSSIPLGGPLSGLSGSCGGSATLMSSTTTPSHHSHPRVALTFPSSPPFSDMRYRYGSGHGSPQQRLPPLGAGTDSITPSSSYFREGGGSLVDQQHHRQQPQHHAVPSPSARLSPSGLRRQKCQGGNSSSSSSSGGLPPLEAHTPPGKGMLKNGLPLPRSMMSPSALTSLTQPNVAAPATTATGVTTASSSSPSPPMMATSAAPFPSPGRPRVRGIPTVTPRGVQRGAAAPRGDGSSSHSFSIASHQRGENHYQHQDWNETRTPRDCAAATPHE